jgi:hypothetical protein
MSILRLLASRPLPCGCVVGIYETYAGPLQWVVDAQGDGCTDPAHQPGRSVSPQKQCDLTPRPGRGPGVVKRTA